MIQICRKRTVGAITNTGVTALENLPHESVDSKLDGVNHFPRTADALSRVQNFGLRPDGYDLRQSGKRSHESKVSFGI